MKEARWEAEWITTAEEIARDIWTRDYKPKPRVSTTSTPTVCCSTFLTLLLLIVIFAQASSSSLNMFASIDNYGVNNTVDAFDAYLASSTIANCHNPLKYWSDNVDDPLSRMGLDFLSTPGTSFIY